MKRNISCAYVPWERKNEWKSILKQHHTWLRYWKHTPLIPTCLLRSGTAMYWSRSEKAKLSLRLEHVDVGLLRIPQQCNSKRVGPARPVLWLRVGQVHAHAHRNVNNATCVWVAWLHRMRSRMTRRQQHNRWRDCIARLTDHAPRGVDNVTDGCNKTTTLLDITLQNDSATI